MNLYATTVLLPSSMSLTTNSPTKCANPNVTFKLVPPHIHCCNASERAIQTWKNYFLLDIARLDPAFPIKNGTVFFNSAKSQSTYFVHTVAIQNYHHGQKSLAPLTPIAHHLHHRAPESSSTKHPINMNPYPLMAFMVGTSDHTWSTTDASTFYNWIQHHHKWSHHRLVTTQHSVPKDYLWRLT